MSRLDARALEAFSGPWLVPLRRFFLANLTPHLSGCRKTWLRSSWKKSQTWASRLETFAHYRMTGRDEFRLRIGDYRVIYHFDVPRNEIMLITLGHRREVYR